MEKILQNNFNSWNQNIWFSHKFRPVFPNLEENFSDKKKKLSRTLKKPILLYLPSTAKKGSTGYGYFTDGTETQRLNYLPVARQKRGGIWNWLQQSYFPRQCLKLCTIFLARPTQSALWRKETSDHRSDLSFDLNFVFCSHLLYIVHIETVYSTALSQKLENNFLPLANIVFGLCGTTEKANAAFHLLLHLHVNMKVSKSVHNTEKISS